MANLGSAASQANPPTASHTATHGRPMQPMQTASDHLRPGGLAKPSSPSVRSGRGGHHVHAERWRPPHPAHPLRRPPETRLICPQGAFAKVPWSSWRRPILGRPRSSSRAWPCRNRRRRCSLWTGSPRTWWSLSSGPPARGCAPCSRRLCIARHLCFSVRNCWVVQLRAMAVLHISLFPNL